VKLPQGRGVKRPCLDAWNTELAQPGAHLTCSPCRKRDSQHSLGHPVGNAVGDGPGLAGARSGKDAHGPARRRRHLTLLGIKGVENVVSSRDAAGSVGWERHCFRSSQTLPSGPCPEVRIISRRDRVVPLRELKIVPPGKD